MFAALFTIRRVVRRQRARISLWRLRSRMPKRRKFTVP
jgi:hypothetical protein